VVEAVWEGRRIGTMLKELLKIYQDSLVNTEAPECLFAKTLIFNEGWLLRSVLNEWRTWSRSSRFGFLPFPAGVKLYSEGQLYTPFKARFRGDDKAESHTHVDGIVGDFSITDTKSGIELSPDLRYIAVFEAKLFAPIAPGTKNAPWYDQVSRTAACLINSILLAEPKGSYDAHLAVLYAEDKQRIDSDLYSKTYIENQITKRTQEFLQTGEPSNSVERFVSEWRDVLNNLQIWFYTWEDIAAEIGNDDLHKFYSLCKTFNK
jgi:hypothetical protein